VKITAAGSKVWVLQLRYPGHPAQSRRTLGTYPSLGVAAARAPSLGVAAARAKATQWYGWVKQGIDPVHAELAERERLEAERRAEALKRENTFASVAERYIAERAGNRRAVADAREIRRMLIAAWGERPIHMIEARDVAS
jgi:Arm DNA-binding domain